MAHAITDISVKKVPWASRYTYGITVLAYLVSQLFTAIPIIVAAAVYGLEAIEDSFLDQPWMSLALTGVGAIGIFLVLYGYMHVKHYSFAWLKIRHRLPLKAVFLVIGTYLLYMLATIIITATIASLVPSFNIEEEQLIGYKDAYGWQLLLAFIGLVVIPPIAEELLFRGFLYQGLRDHWRGLDALKWGLGIAVAVAALLNPIAGILIALSMYLAVLLGKNHPARAAALVTSVLFGLVHMQWNIAIDTFIFSFALIYVFEKTQNLWASIALHALKNGVAFIGIFLLT
jgi:membrane protease YdiL (CAAX protease family)